MEDHLKTFLIWRDSNLLLLEIEKSVRNFSRYNRYSVGTDLRTIAIKICKLTAKGLNFKSKRRENVEELNEAVFEIKILLQLGKELGVFKNFKEFENLSKIAISIGKQSGSWLKKLAPET